MAVSWLGCSVSPLWYLQCPLPITVAAINVPKNLTGSYLEFLSFLETGTVTADVFLPDQRDKWRLGPFACLLCRVCVPPVALTLTSPWLPSQAPRNHIYLLLFGGIKAHALRMCSSWRWAPNVYPYHICSNLAKKCPRFLCVPYLFLQLQNTGQNS